MSGTAPHNDKPAAFKGMIITTLALVAMSYIIVLLTNRQFAGHAAGGAPAAAEAAKH